jgi:hypothetical protein
MSDSLSRVTPDDLARLVACQKRLKRAEAEYKAALAEHAVVTLDLEPYALGPGDKIDQITGDITRAQMDPPAASRITSDSIEALA